MLTSDKIIEIFVNVDDFCKEFETEIAKHQLDAGNYKIRDRKTSLADSEIITILIAFHSGYFTNLKHFISVISAVIVKIIFRAWYLIIVL
jgi:hypothetical protein